MNITTYGDDARLAVCKRSFEAATLPVTDAVLFPIPSTRDGVTVTGCGIPLDTVPLPAGALVLGYGLPDAFVTRAEAVGCTVADAATEEDYLGEGARLTALGCLFRLSEMTGKAPSSFRLGIVGYGRIGKEIARLSLVLGAEVTVFTGREDVRVALGRVGIPTVLARYGAGAAIPAGIDVLINTAPARLFGADAFPEAHGILAVELASGDFFPAEAHPVRLPALPAKLFPVSAGEAYAKAGLRALGRKEAAK